MPYVVYVNHPNNKAIVHNINCTFYQRRKRDKTHNGYWSIVEEGTFKELEEALSYAQRTGKANIDTCAFCIQ